MPNADDLEGEENEGVSLPECRFPSGSATVPGIRCYPRETKDLLPLRPFERAVHEISYTFHGHDCRVQMSGVNAFREGAEVCLVRLFKNLKLRKIQLSVCGPDEEHMDWAWSAHVCLLGVCCGGAPGLSVEDFVGCVHVPSLPHLRETALKSLSLRHDEPSCRSYSRLHPSSTRT